MKKPFELIEKYIEGDLDSSSKAEVEKWISQDKEFASEYRLRLEVNQALEQKEVMQLRATLKDIILRNAQQPNVIHLFKRNWHLVAASITVLLVVGSVYLGNRRSTDSGLFNSYYNKENAYVSTRSHNANFQENLQAALQKYELDEYDSAIILLEDINDNLVADYYLGLAYIEVEEYEKAMLSFDRILNEDSNLFEEQAEWYNALCMLKVGQTEDAMQVFENISESNSLYKEDAQKILEAIK
ncbi:MAG: hypothetical protein CL663_08075 [Bacteroidetes bacterium]|nr:hypothetical protein [Bacteroidota bacterium]